MDIARQLHIYFPDVALGELISLKLDATSSIQAEITETADQDPAQCKSEPIFGDYSATCTVM